jgi:hypothetical protein
MAGWMANCCATFRDALETPRTCNAILHHVSRSSFTIVPLLLYSRFLLARHHTSDR